MDGRSLFQLMPLVLTCVLAGIGALLPALVTGQAHNLRVTIHDPDDRALAGVTIVLRAESGEELARQTTDAAGTASFDDLPAIVRVRVEGQPRSGPHFYQLGADAQGIRMALVANTRVVELNLRVERDGLVLPDPATEVVREEGGPLVHEATAFPTAPVATPRAAATAPSLSPVPTAADVALAEPSQRDPWAPWATVLVIACAFGLLRLVQRRRDAR
jgi:hypothetical protein